MFTSTIAHNTNPPIDFHPCRCYYARVSLFPTR
nr:MAG TPA: hypothetical protein [Caudoviricetes sp.]